MDGSGVESYLYDTVPEPFRDICIFNIKVAAVRRNLCVDSCAKLEYGLAGPPGLAVVRDTVNRISVTISVNHIRILAKG
jgi:hypothetical protein